MPPTLNPLAGLVSVTFRQLDPAAIIDLAFDNGLGLIEWGGDVHVPHGDLIRAENVGKLTRGRGLEVGAYGSYYRLGSVDAELSFRSVLETAVVLGAAVIRVWAGSIGSEVADESIWERVTHDAERVAALAAEQGVRVAIEFHSDTLHDTPEGACRLLATLTHAGLCSLWQPIPTLERARQDESLAVVLPRLSHLHVYQWRPGPPITRHPLEEGRTEWAHWLSMIRQSEREIPALLEFVENDDPEQLPREAATLHTLLRNPISNP
jgi:sugar phosphate isomerase/epimerase